MRLEYANGQARSLLGLGTNAVDLSVTEQPLGAGARDVARELFAAESPRRLRVSDGDRSFVISGIPPARDRETAIIAIRDESQRERHERAQRQFATNAAHQLRTPLASIVTAVEMLQTGAKDDVESRDRFLEIIERESQRLSRLTQALLVLARAKASEERPRLENISLRPLLERLARETVARAGLHLVVVCPAALEVHANEGLLEQALACLIENAVRHAGSGTIKLRAARSGDKVTVEVVDRGQGMAARDQEAAFERFYRGGGSDESSGFGLGLAIARDSVRSMGGEIELQSQQNAGTTVRLMFEGAAS